MECIVYADCASLQLRTQAREFGLSPGKFKLIEILQTLDPSITVEQYRNAKVTEIIIKANELLASTTNGTPQLGEFERNRGMITAVAQQIMNRELNQTQYQLREQTQTQTQAQTQTQTQT